MKEQNTEDLMRLKSNLVSIYDGYLSHCRVGLEAKRKDAKVIIEFVPPEEIPLILKAMKIFEEWIQFMIKTKSLMLNSPTHKDLVSIFNDFLIAADETSSKFDEINKELISTDQNKKLSKT